MKAITRIYHLRKAFMCVHFLHAMRHNLLVSLHEQSFIRGDIIASSGNIMDWYPPYVIARFFKQQLAVNAT